MRDIERLLNAAKAARRLPSDYAIAKKLSIAPTEIYAWRSGRRVPPQKYVVALADLAGEPVGHWLALLEAERAHSAKLADAWRDVAKQIPA